MEITRDHIYEIYRHCYNDNLSKGIKKNVLNDTIIKILEKENETKQLTYQKEVKVRDIFGEDSTFNVDIAIYNEKKELDTVVLIKAPASSLGKNRKNALTAQLGEYFRIDKETYPNLKIMQILLFPNKTPLIKENVLKSFDSNSSIFLTKRRKFFEFDIHEIHVTFDIENIETCKNKNDIHNLFIENNPIKNIKVEETIFLKNE